MLSPSALFLLAKSKTLCRGRVPQNVVPRPCATVTPVFFDMAQQDEFRWTREEAHDQIVLFSEIRSDSGTMSARTRSG